MTTPLSLAEIVNAAVDEKRPELVTGLMQLEVKAKAAIALKQDWTTEMAMTEMSQAFTVWLKDALAAPVADIEAKFEAMSTRIGQLETQLGELREAHNAHRHAYGTQDDQGNRPQTDVPTSEVTAP